MLRWLYRSKSTKTATSPTRDALCFRMPDGVRVYAVGDIHGRAGLLKKMLAAIDADAADHPASETIEIFLGDYIDRGMESNAVLEMLQARPAPGRSRICLLGNHEDTLLRFLEEPKLLREWGNYGGYATLAAYGIPIPASVNIDTSSQIRDQLRKAMPPSHLEFLKNLPLTHQVGDYFFVHAGVYPGKAVSEQSREHLLWIRDIFLKHAGSFGPYVVHGHSPVAAPDVRMNRANVDVSDAASPSLACLVLEGDQRRILLVTE